MKKLGKKLSASLETVESYCTCYCSCDCSITCTCSGTDTSHYLNNYNINNSRSSYSMHGSTTSGGYGYQHL